MYIFKQVTSVDCTPAAVKSESWSSPRKVSVSSEASRTPSQICSPAAESKRPKWVPPGMYSVFIYCSRAGTWKIATGSYIFLVNVMNEHFLILLPSLQN